MTAASLSPKDKIELVKQVYSLLRILHDEEALAGIVLTSGSFNEFRALLGEACIPYQPAELVIDPQMETTFVVDGLLIMRGTQLQ